ncbi:hypothetical protein PMI27_005958 [Pseudomonas sp. GM41(2012)]|jgi:outer membrane protein TolC|uniref:hypothetical protein n=1 Tax=Pseudomonas sp. (strain GM41(2012)) TaxID=1144708 RepID=UPI00026FEF89|nr:hypothetical protein PMI27_005958 [Pseudomonas sp. GM41(2012)]
MGLSACTVGPDFQGALLATQEQFVESSTGVSLAMVGLYKALGGGWESVYPLASVVTSNPV